MSMAESGMMIRIERSRVEEGRLRRARTHINGLREARLWLPGGGGWGVVGKEEGMSTGSELIDHGRGKKG